jgi:hypothetical protein
MACMTTGAWIQNIADPRSSTAVSMKYANDKACVRKRTDNSDCEAYLLSQQPLGASVE